MEDFPEVSTLSNKALEEEQAWALHRVHEIRDKLPLSCTAGGYYPGQTRDGKVIELERLEAHLSDTTAEIARRGLVSPR